MAEPIYRLLACKISIMVFIGAIHCSHKKIPNPADENHPLSSDIQGYVINRSEHTESFDFEAADRLEFFLCDPRSSRYGKIHFQMIDAIDFALPIIRKYLGIGKDSCLYYSLASLSPHTYNGARKSAHKSLNQIGL
jgi:hypothetical protein